MTTDHTAAAFAALKQRDQQAALEQITLLTAQNAQLQALNTRHVQQLEQLCEERDAARAQLKARDAVRE